jgi:hypothetical protein
MGKKGWKEVKYTKEIKESKKLVINEDTKEVIPG